MLIWPAEVMLTTISQFSDAMLALEKAAEKAKEDARADVQERRIERWVHGINLPVNPLNLYRIWERLSEDGWREEIETNKSTYERGLLKIKGVVMARPLGEKGAQPQIPDSNVLKIARSMGRTPGTPQRVHEGRIKARTRPGIPGPSQSPGGQNQEGGLPTPLLTSSSP